MYFYLVIFLFILLSNIVKINFSKDAKHFFYFVIFIFLVLFVGFRYQVGGDWETYLDHYENIDFGNILFTLISWDPAYVFVEYISKYLGFGIWGVNTICAILFFLCFFYFIKVFKISLSYALLIAFPYLILVVINGYTRQGVALGLGMLFIALLYQRKFLKSFLALILAVLFHKTAILLTILYIRDSIKKIENNLIKIIVIILSILLVILMYNLFLKSWESMIKYYIEYQMQSTGGIIRITLNVIPVILLFIFAKRYKKFYNDYDFWLFFGFISIFMLFIAVFYKITTVADRLCLYFYPYQIVILPRILKLIKLKESKYLYSISLLYLYSFILVIWLLFAKHRESWIPYKNYLILLME